MPITNIGPKAAAGITTLCSLGTPVSLVAVQPSGVVSAASRSKSAASTSVWFGARAAGAEATGGGSIGVPPKTGLAFEAAATLAIVRNTVCLAISLGARMPALASCSVESVLGGIVAFIPLPCESLVCLCLS